MTKRKIINKFAIRMFAVGVFITAAAFFVGQVLDVMSTEKKLDDTLANLRSQCVNYDTVVTADKTKSIMRLAEQITEIRRDVEFGGALPDDAALQSFAAEQRLSGVAFLNEKLEPDLLYADGNFVFADWSDVINTKAIADIMNYPKKVYCERLQHGGLFDLAAVCRYDAKGIIIGWRYQSALLVAESRSSLDNLIAGYESESDVTVYIASEGLIHGTNDRDMTEKRIEEIPALAELDKSDKFGKVVRIETYDGVHYGGKMRYGEYTLYACYPYSQIYAVRRVLIPFILGLYIMCCLFGYMLQVRLERRHIEEAQTRIDTIKSISSIYTISLMMNLKDDRFDIIRIPSQLMTYLYGSVSVRQLTENSWI